MSENPTEDADGTGVIQWEEAWFERPGERSIRVDSVEFGWKLHKNAMSQSIRVRHDPEAIVRDAIDGTLLFVDDDGTVVGDVESGGQSSSSPQS